MECTLSGANVTDTHRLTAYVMIIRTSRNLVPVLNYLHVFNCSLCCQSVMPITIMYLDSEIKKPPNLEVIIHMKMRISTHLRHFSCVIFR